MKRLTALFLTLALAASLGLGARAAAAARLVRAFVYQDTLYTYVDLTGTEAPITKAEAEIGGQVFPATGTLETVRQAGFPAAGHGITVEEAERDILRCFREETAE